MLSETQKKLVEDNIKLVFHCLHKNHLPMDMQDIGYVGLCKAAKTFKTGYNLLFSTYAVKCINNELYLSQRKDYRAKQRFGETISLSHVILDNGKDEEITLQDMIPDKSNKYEIYQIINNYEKFIEELPNNVYKQIMKDFYLGYPQSTMVKRYNKSQATISRIIKKYNQKFIHIYYQDMSLYDILKEE